MTSVRRNVAFIGATGTLGIPLLRALTSAGHTVTVIQRKESTTPPPSGVKSAKVDLTNFDELVSVFKGHEVYLNATPYPSLSMDKVIIDAAVAASVKRIIPSEFTTNLDSPLSRKLPHMKGKTEVREYLESVISRTNTSWTSINNGSFFEMGLKFGFIGPNIAQEKAVFHDGGEKVVGASTLPDIGAALVKILDPAHFEETANKPVYMYSAAVSERMLTNLVSKVAGIDFGTMEDGRITNISVDEAIEEGERKLVNGDKSGMLAYYYKMMYGDGYGGTDFENLSWNERLGLRIMTEKDIETLISEIARELGVL
ncbi:NAD(P)-binding protein [Hypoxylon sp. NC0597]|nr:NAD(P)-binding protein [Hypoxylon sp. NC0597]